MADINNKSSELLQSDAKLSDAETVPQEWDNL